MCPHENTDEKVGNPNRAGNAEVWEVCEDCGEPLRIVGTTKIA